MLQGIREMGLACLPWSEGARSLRARVQFLRRMFPDAAWPDLSDDHLRATLEDWLLPYLRGHLAAGASRSAGHAPDPAVPHPA